MFYELFLKLCAKKGVSPSKALADMNLSNGNLQRWRDGSSPRNATMWQLSEYFNVPFDVIMGREDLDVPTPTDADYIPPSPMGSPYQSFLSTVSLLNEDEIRQLTAQAIQLLGKRNAVL